MSLPIFSLSPEHITRHGSGVNSQWKLSALPFIFSLLFFLFPPRSGAQPGLGQSGPRGSRIRAPDPPRGAPSFSPPPFFSSGKTFLPPCLPADRSSRHEGREERGVVRREAEIALDPRQLPPLLLSCFSSIFSFLFFPCTSSMGRQGRKDARESVR